MQVSLAAVNQILCISWGYERLQKSKDSLKDCFENVNILLWVDIEFLSSYESYINLYCLCRPELV